MTEKRTIWVAYTNTDCTEGRGRDVPIAFCAAEATEPKEQVTNTRRRNADDMGNPPANASELLNAWKPKP